MTYVALLQALMGWIRKAEAEQEFPTFIRLAEAKMGRVLAEAGVTGAIQRKTGPVGAEFVGLPADLAIPMSMTLTEGGEVVTNTTPDTIDRLRETENALPGKPRYFAVINGEMRLYPAPDRAYASEFVYQSGIAAIGPATSTNWLLSAYPDAYLYGALVYAGEYSGDEPRLNSWRGQFEVAMAEIIAAERAKRGSMRVTLRTELPLSRGSFNIYSGA